jgi:hypothetical protein
VISAAKPSAVEDNSKGFESGKADSVPATSNVAGTTDEEDDGHDSALLQGILSSAMIRTGSKPTVEQISKKTLLQYETRRSQPALKLRYPRWKISSNF